jgi:hypothetical protein
MKSILDIFDYTFYRVAKAYKKWDGFEGITAIFAVSLSQSMILLDIILFIILETLNKSERLDLKPYDKISTVTIMLVIFILNFIRYKGKFSVFDERWKNELRNKKIINGIFVILLILGPIVFPMLLLNLKDYTH